MVFKFFNKLLKIICAFWFFIFYLYFFTTKEYVNAIVLCSVFIHMARIELRKITNENPRTQKHN